eukprot:TRINITY_DN6775_c0_g1_i1.p1 TRINITY_DN6775_c0_g1~~TRINITY_DN6775_c0_g1_i1.p1  ORF type:complete len:558 (-),score=112.35 TRINITY_DN6775_c0_g1_i1:103-1776(-)
MASENRPYHHPLSLRDAAGWQAQGSSQKLIIDALQPGDLSSEIDRMTKVFYDSMTAMERSMYVIQQISVLKNDALLQMFQGRLALLSGRRNKPAFAPQWQKMTRSSDRQVVLDRLQQFVVHEEDGVKLALVFHGTRSELVDEIADTGFATLGLVDGGFFGKGVYTTPQAGYACRVYGKGVVIVSCVAMSNVLPILKEDQEMLQGKSNFENYDCHYAPVVPRAADNPTEMCFDACGWGQTPAFDEIVVFHENQVLPMFAVHYVVQQPTISSVPSMITAKQLCIGCGTKLPLKAKFCMECGQPSPVTPPTALPAMARLQPPSIPTPQPQYQRTVESTASHTGTVNASEQQHSEQEHDPIMAMMNAHDPIEAFTPEDVARQKCSSEFNVQRCWRDTWQQTYAALRHWKGVFGACYDEYWSSNACADSFKFSCTDNGVEIRVVYDNRWLCTQIRMTQTGQGRQFISFHCAVDASDAPHFEYAVERITPSDLAARTEFGQACTRGDVLALYVYSFKSDRVWFGSLLRGRPKPVAAQLELPFYTYAPREEMVHVFPAFSTAVL